MGDVVYISCNSPDTCTGDVVYISCNSPDTWGMWFILAATRPIPGGVVYMSCNSPDTWGMWFILAATRPIPGEMSAAIPFYLATHFQTLNNIYSTLIFKFMYTLFISFITFIITFSTRSIIKEFSISWELTFQMSINWKEISLNV